MKNRKKTEQISLFPPLFEPLSRQGPVVADPQGSYTGYPLDSGEVPVQDADDL